MLPNTVQDATVVQLIPYGWQLPDGTAMREAVYAGIAHAANASYYRWENPNPQHAFFRRFDVPPLRHCAIVEL